jgi:hypothetical protein
MSIRIIFWKPGSTKFSPGPTAPGELAQGELQRSLPLVHLTQPAKRDQERAERSNKQPNTRGRIHRRPS